MKSEEKFINEGGIIGTDCSDKRMSKMEYALLKAYMDRARNNYILKQKAEKDFVLEKKNQFRPCR